MVGDPVTGEHHGVRRQPVDGPGPQVLDVDRLQAPVPVEAHHPGPGAQGDPQADPDGQGEGGQRLVPGQVGHHGHGGHAGVGGG